MFTGTKKFLIVTLFVIVLIALVNLAWWLYYGRTEKLMDQQLSRRLSAVAQTGRVALTPEMVEGLVLGDINAYSDAINVLDNIRRSDSLSEVFIVDRNYRILASTSLDADTVYFLVGLNGQYIDSALLSLSDITVATPSYKTGRIYLKSAFAPLYDIDGLPAAALGVEANVDYFDVLTDLKKNLYYSAVISILGGLLMGLIFLLFQRAINHAEQQLFLNQTHAYLGRMVAVVSHEVKNPLMIIRASAERLFKKQPNDESRFIVEEVDRLNDIVTGYLSFASAKGSFIGSDKTEPVNLAQLAENIMKHFQSKYPEQPITWLDGRIPADLSLETNLRSLRQVILNLLINGADACLSAGKPIAVGITAENRGTEIKIRVIDHGPGISKKEIKKIFAPFYTTKQTGSGLGLYLSKKIIEEMGGSIHIESQLGKRTEITIALPGKLKR